MKNIKQLMQEIVEFTTEIETNYPELYKYLDETPILISNSTNKGISSTDLENYLNTLKEQLKDYIKTHLKSNNQSVTPV
jgi:hypothetical protein